ncbi:hypothetical protein [uncultured Clostridium sp.]|uniref:hypothetical protein n=1 Tax=uncultured Clostridium sp. TaxID=59620 RepID=UPI002599C57E|nr:hypothetical protein [uncultured Clostridium sp.]
MKKEHYERLQEMLDDLCSALSEGFALFLIGKRNEVNENGEKIDKIKKDIEKYVEEENINFNEYKEMYDTAVNKWANVDGVNIQRRFR